MENRIRIARVYNRLDNRYFKGVVDSWTLCHYLLTVMPFQTQINIFRKHKSTICLVSISGKWKVIVLLLFFVVFLRGIWLVHFVSFCNLQKEIRKSVPIWGWKNKEDIFTLRWIITFKKTKRGIFIHIFCCSEYQQAPVDIKIPEVTGLIINKHMTSFNLTIVGQRSPCDTSSCNNVCVFTIYIALVLAGLKLTPSGMMLKSALHENLF